MKSLILILSFIYFPSSFGQNQNEINFAEIYTKGETFYFKYSIKKGDKSYSILPTMKEQIGMSVISRNEYDQYILPSNTDTIFVDTLIFSLQTASIRHEKNKQKLETGVWFCAARFQREFGFLKINDSKSNFKLSPYEDYFYHTGFMNSLLASPSPMILKTPKVGTTWKDSTSISDKHSHVNWKIWSDSLTVRSSYTILNKDSIQTNLGKLETWQIKAKSESSIGSSSLDVHFSSIYGFVILDYTLVDGTQFRIELIGKKEANQNKF